MLIHIFLYPTQVDFGHGAAQAYGASFQERPVVQEPSEDAGGQRGHQTRVHGAETERGSAGEQEDEGWEEWVLRRQLEFVFAVPRGRVRNIIIIYNLQYCINLHHLKQHVNSDN